MGQETEIPLKYFVGGVVKDVRQKDLSQFFSQFGVVQKITTYNPKGGKKLLGFCFIKFKSLFNGIDLSHIKLYFRNRLLEIKPMARRGLLKRQVQERNSRRIFLPDVPLGLSNETILAEFSKFGETRTAYTVPRAAKPEEGSEANLSQSQFGVVVFQHPETVSMLVQRGYIHLSTGILLEIKPCVTQSKQYLEEASKELDLKEPQCFKHKAEEPSPCSNFTYRMTTHCPSSSKVDSSAVQVGKRAKEVSSEVDPFLSSRGVKLGNQKQLFSETPRSCCSGWVEPKDWPRPDFSLRPTKKKYFIARKAHCDLSSQPLNNYRLNINATGNIQNSNSSQREE